MIRRNPITGEVLEEQQQQFQHQQPTSNGNGNATVNMNGSMNGMILLIIIIIINLYEFFLLFRNQGSNGSASMPNTPVRVRQPPGE